ncbi:hypothetical protein ACJ41O_005440 [Fusarium nematophilum]
MHAQIEHSLDVSIWPPPTKSAAAAAAAATEQSSALAPDPLRPNCSDDGESAVSGVSEERGHEFMDGEGGHHGIHGGGDAEDRDGIDGLLRNDVLDSGEDADDEDSSYDTLINDTLDAEMEHYLVGGYGIHHEATHSAIFEGAIMIDPPSRSLRDKCLEVKDKVDAFLAEEPDTQLLRDVQAQLRVSIEVVEEALDKYGPEQISLSYNGGKDCLVLLIVILSCLGRRYSTSSATNGTSKSSYLSLEKIQAVYIVAAHPFPEIDSFVESSSAEYSLEVARYVLPMKKGLEIYLEERPSVQAIFVGTRRTDPHGEKLRHFDPTDKGWPSFMRVHPVIDWHYAQIWAFIRHLGISYCPLYDQGYTSLGGKKDTHPNPHLKKQGQNGESFRPAYELTEDDEERLGRDT